MSPVFAFSGCTPSVVSCVCCLVLVVIIVCCSFYRGAAYVDWAYKIGDQPVYRLLFLLLIAFACMHPSFFPVALLLALLFMLINSMVPMLTDLDETFVFGAPLINCNAYSKVSVNNVGTPFYPINVVEKAFPNGGDGAGEMGDEGIPLGVGEASSFYQGGDPMPAPVTASD